MARENTLAVQFERCQGTLLIHAAFRTVAPWSILFGPSGSGKSTMLQTISGLLQPERGQISTWAEQASREHVLFQSNTGISVPPWKRPFRSAAQQPRLFPHKTVRQNILYGARPSASEAASSDLFEEVLQLFRLQPFASRKPHQLSGGEQQRVAVARAVFSAASAEVSGGMRLLLDEPFSGMGAALRDHLPLELKEWLARRSLPVLSVSHDIGEAFLLQAEVLRVEEGRIVDQGTADTVLAEDRARLLRRLAPLP